MRPLTLDGLAPLDEGEKQTFGLGAVATDLAYRYESPSYQGTVEAIRREPRITARTLSFIRIEPDVRHARYEIIYEVQRAGARELSLLLPADTPQALSIVGLDGVALKGYVSEPAELDGAPMRRWTATLTDARRGPVRLAIDLQQRTDHGDGAEAALPLVVPRMGSPTSPAWSRSKETPSSTSTSSAIRGASTSASSSMQTTSPDVGCSAPSGSSAPRLPSP